MIETLSRTQEVLLRLLRHRSYATALSALRKMHPADLAVLYPFLDEEDKAWLADAVVKSGQLMDVLRELGEEERWPFSQHLAEDDLALALQRMNPDDVTDTISVFPHEQQLRLLDRLTGQQKAVVAKLLGFDPETAGGIMTTDYVAVRQSTTVAAAIDDLRQQSSSEVFYVYVIDDEDRLVGVVSFRDLVLSSPDAKLGDIMKRDPVSVTAGANQEDVAAMIQRYDLLSLPVVDEHHRLIGRITVDDALDVLEEEATEDIYRLASLSAEEHLSTSILTAARRRAPWLLLNLGTALLASATVTLFSATIGQFVLLAALMPIIAGMGGNAGTQSLAVTVRGLALGEVDPRIGWRVVMKEVGIGVLNGALNGTVIGVLAYVWYGNIALALLMFVAMIVNLILAGLFGSVVPLVLRKLKQDPALGSSIFVTTATDVGGFMVFLGLATIFIHLLVP